MLTLIGKALFYPVFKIWEGFVKISTIGLDETRIPEDMFDDYFEAEFSGKEYFYTRPSLFEQYKMNTQ